MASLSESLASAWQRRASLLARLREQGTDSLRVFHGTVEGRAGLTLDRYGSVLLAQTFREPLTADELDAVRLHAAQLGLPLVWNHRGRERVPGYADELALVPQVCREHGTALAFQARHRGQDPWFFLDLRLGRAVLAREAAHKSFLNLYSYTAAASLVALQHGAHTCLTADFAASALDVAKRHAELNGIDPARLGCVQEDCIPIARQLAGLPVKGRGAARAYERVLPRRFDIVLLDPPAYSRGPFGAVDVERDYPSLAKPALLALEPGGLLLATNHVAGVSRAQFAATLARTAEKCGVALQSLEVQGADEDFPTVDGEGPFKLALVRRAPSV